MNKKATGADKLSQILLYVVMGFLLLFLGMGIYFVMRGFLDPTMDTRTIGFIGIAIFLIGMGIVVLLQTSMMQDENGSFLETFFMSNSATEEVHVSLKKMPKAKQLEPILQFAAHVTIGKLSGNCMFMVCDDGLWFQGLWDSLLSVKYSDISSMDRDKAVMTFQGSCQIDEDLYEGEIIIRAENAMRLRAADEEIKKWIE